MDEFTEEQAKAIMGAGLGRAELETVTSFAAPLFWVIRDADKEPSVRNGTAFFLDAGHGVFGVTAAHVIAKFQEHNAAGRTAELQIGNGEPVDLAGENAVIAIDHEIDIATFKFSATEVAKLEKFVLTGSQPVWPPSPPMRDRAVTYSGYPGVERRWVGPDLIEFGATPGGGIATSISELNISTQIDREKWLDMLGLGLPAENYHFGGISGGPMLKIVEHKQLRTWALAGVIIQGPNTCAEECEAIAGFEVIRARRAHFILPDGSLDISRWRSVA